MVRPDRCGSTIIPYSLEVEERLVSIPGGRLTVRMRNASPEVRCDHVYQLNRELISSRHVIAALDDERIISSALLEAAGGASGVHEHSVVVVGDRCFVAVGDHVVALQLPTLDLVWARVVDPATCFGVHVLSGNAGLISHGELEIARVTFDGEIAWSVSGADIFTGELVALDDEVRVTDFEGTRYRFASETGAVLSVSKTP